MTLARAAGYDNAGTVEFLVDVDTRRVVLHRGQPAHPGRAHGHRDGHRHRPRALPDPDRAGATRCTARRSACRSRTTSRSYGYALQCRVTTEDPGEQLRPRLRPDSHLPLARRASASGSTAASAYGGAVITPFYDSLLVKVTAWGRDFRHACQRMDRALREFRVRGVKTNIPFLENVVNHPDFPGRRRRPRGSSTRRRSCSSSRRGADRATKLLTYLGDVIVNGNPASRRQAAGRRACARRRCRRTIRAAPPDGTRQLLHEARAREVRRMDARAEAAAAHRHHVPRRAPVAAGHARPHLRHAGDRELRRRTGCTNLFSLEMWGGATFDVAMRFLTKIRGSACAQLREAIPNICFQMLLRASNAVGYTNYPDNVVAEFVNEAAAQGIDIFRIFDSLNWLPNMKVVDGGGAQDAGRSAKRRSATPATSSTRSATSTRSNTTSGWRRNWSAWARTSSPSRTWPGCASRTRPSSWSRRCARRSASRSTSTRTTPAASTPPPS